jgi:hypothetical protein
MKFITQHKATYTVLLISLLLLVISGVVQYGKRLSIILPCTSNPTNSSYCYSTYDAVINIILILTILFCLVGLMMDYFRRKGKKQF